MVSLRGASMLDYLDMALTGSFSWSNESTEQRGRASVNLWTHEGLMILSRHLQGSEPWLEPSVLGGISHPQPCALEDDSRIV